MSPPPASEPPGAGALAETLGSRLQDALPAPPADVLLLAAPGPVTDRLAAALGEAGHSVLRAPLPEAAPGRRGGGPDHGEQEPEEDGQAAAARTLHDAVVVLATGGARDPGPWMAAVAGRVRGDGRLVVAERLVPEAARRLDRSLLEHGYVELALESLPGAAGSGPGGAALRLHTARPARHRVRPYREGDEAAILELFERAFHHRRSVEHWRWEYTANPLGNRRISLAVDGDDRLAAHYAGYPVRFWSDVDGPPRVLDALHVGDTMTAPEARRVGRGRTNLLTRTVRHFYATWCHGRVDFNFGANTGKIQRFSRRTAGARRLEAVPYRVRELPGAPFPAPAPLAARLAGWRVARVDDAEGIDGRWDALWRRVRGAYRFLLERDRRYVAWRYAAHPDVEYRIWTVLRFRRLVGWAVFRRQGDRLVWGDALFDPRHPQAPAVLLSRVVAAPENRDARCIEGWLTDRPAWWGRTVAELGFERRPEPEDLGYVYVPFRLDPSAAMEEHLYYTKGDCDLF